MRVARIEKKLLKSVGKIAHLKKELVHSALYEIVMPRVYFQNLRLGDMIYTLFFL